MARMPDQVYAVCRVYYDKCGTHRLDRMNPVEVLTSQQEAIGRLYYYRGMMPDEAFVLLEVRPQMAFTLIKTPVMLGGEATKHEVASTLGIICPESVWALMAACSAIAYIETEGEAFADGTAEPNQPVGDRPSGG